MKAQIEAKQTAASKETALYETPGIVYLSTTRWLLLLVGCVFPEVAGAFLVLRIFPYISVILLGSAMATTAFLFAVLRKQHCTVRIFKDSLQIVTARGTHTIPKKHVRDVSLVRGQITGVQLLTRDEIQVVEMKNPELFISAFRK